MPNTEQSPRDPLKALSEIARMLNSIQKIEVLLEKVLDIAIETLDAERGLILEESPQEPSGFAVKCSRNIADEQAAKIAQFSRSVVLEVLESGETTLIHEAFKDPRYKDSESIVIQKIQSIACVPLRIKNKKIGVIYLDSLTRRSRFTPASLPFLNAFADQAAIAIENASFYQRLREENRNLREELQRIHGFSEIIGESVRMKEIFDILARVIDSEASVLIEGESGTGKELIARAIHYNGERKDKPFIALFCGSLPDSLLESELFGHKKGAFTGAISDKKGLFEAADGGTFFLDEIGDLGPQIQSKLLRVLQEGEIKRVGENQVRQVDVRIISATNKNLRDLVKDGIFREDLYYRLNTITIQMPPLRARKSDIPLLANHFLDKYAGKRRGQFKGFEKNALEALMAYSWPGNVRELENTIERAVVMTRSEFIGVQDLQLPEGEALNPLESGLTLQEIEKRAALQALKDHDNNVSHAARVLGVSRRWLHYKIKEWQL